MSECNGVGNEIKSIHEILSKLKSDLQIERVLYANMKKVLKKRELEITNLYNIIYDLMNNKK